MQQWALFAQRQLLVQVAKDSALWQTPEKARAYMLATYQQLLPLYQLAVAQ